MLTVWQEKFDGVPLQSQEQSIGIPFAPYSVEADRPALLCARRSLLLASQDMCLLARGKLWREDACWAESCRLFSSSVLH